jgi:DNA-binding response OmpR family regulator
MPQTPALEGKRILIVEDDFSYRTFLLSALRKTGASCAISIDSESAKTKLAAEQFDILILDYLLPGHNAMEIVKWIREQNNLTPVLIVTAYPSDELAEKCREESNITIAAKSNITAEYFPIVVANTLNR